MEGGKEAKEMETAENGSAAAIPSAVARSPEPSCSGVTRDRPEYVVVIYDSDEEPVNPVPVAAVRTPDDSEITTSCLGTPTSSERDNRFESDSDWEPSAGRKVKNRRWQGHCRCCPFSSKRNRTLRKESDENRVESSGEKNLEKELSKESHSESETSEESPQEVEPSGGSADSAGSQCDDPVNLNKDTGPEGSTSPEDKKSQDNETKLTPELNEDFKDKSPKSQNGDINALQNSVAEEIPTENKNNKDKTASAPRNPTPESETKTPLRRSLRTIKRKRYDMDLGNGDDGSDCDEFLPHEPSRKKSKSSAAHSKPLVDMTSKHSKSGQGNNKKDPNIVILDSKFIPGKVFGSHVNQRQNQKPSGLTVSDPQFLYRNIMARGTSVTPVPPTPAPARVNVSTQSPSPQPILPSLTDDMFVVEAPSFIVPYVYEKPSIKPFREFVDVLGSELAEQKAKEERAEKERREKEKKEKLERGEIDNAEDEPEKNEKQEESGEKEKKDEEDNEKTKLDTEEMDAEDENKKKKPQKKEGRKRRNADDDDESWDGESSDSEDAASDEEGKMVVIKEKLDDSANFKDVTELTVDKVVNGKVDNYFDCTLGKFFLDIGLGLVQEVVQTDLLKLQKKKLYKEKKLGYDTKPTEAAVVGLKKNLEFSKRNNASFHFPQTKCHLCDFHTESTTVMSHHLEAPHFKNGLYKCNYCEYEIRSSHDILFHTETVHNVRSRLERAISYHQCPNCTFEDNGKGKLARHAIACVKKFKPDFNLAPAPEWEPPAKIPKQIAKSRNHIIGPYPSVFQRSQSVVGSSRPLVGATIANPIPIGYKPRNRSPMVATVRPTPIQPTSIMRGGVTIRHSNPAMLNNLALGKSVLVPRPYNQPSISITPLPRGQALPATTAITTATATVTVGTGKSRHTCILCEICDGYIRDLEQLRHHMQFVHKVRIHPKMIYSRPPLNCQKCQLRFFTDQGLERHLLGSHGLVTSNMQQAANKGKDAGRCPVCGRVYQWKLLSHVSRDHVITLKPAHLSYKCTVCAATFALYKDFEEHVYAEHTVGAKRAIDRKRARDVPAIPESLKKNTQVTVTPQPVKAPAAATSSPVALAVTVSMSPVPSAVTEPPVVTITPTVAEHSAVGEPPAKIDPPVVTITPAVADPTGVTITPAVADPAGVTITPAMADPTGVTLTPAVADPPATNAPDITVTPAVADPTGVTITPAVADPTAVTITPAVADPPATNPDITVTPVEDDAPAVAESPVEIEPPVVADPPAEKDATDDSTSAKSPAPTESAIEEATETAEEPAAGTEPAKKDKE